MKFDIVLYFNDGSVSDTVFNVLKELELKPNTVSCDDHYSISNCGNVVHKLEPHHQISCNLNELYEEQWNRLQTHIKITQMAQSGTIILCIKRTYI